MNEKTKQGVPTSEFDELLNREYHYFLHLNRLYQLQVKILEACEGRIIKNDLVYHQMLFASFDGLFTRLDNFHLRLIKLLNNLKTDHLNRFKRSNKKGLTVDPSRMNCINGPDPGAKFAAQAMSEQFYTHFNEVYDRVFPRLKLCSAGRPNHADFDHLAERLREAFKPIRAHRDTVVAHWDEKQEPATVIDLKNAILHIEQLLKDIFYLSKLSSVSFELGGVTADVERTAKKLIELILGTYRVRRARPEEMNSIYLMGFDSWSNELSEHEYLAQCQNSPKYAKGTWFVLEDNDGKAVSSLITYEFDPLNGKAAIGLGSIATQSEFRKKGLASQLAWQVMTLFFERDGSRAFFLYADLNPQFYERHLGFVRLPDKYQSKSGSVAMIRASTELKNSLFKDENFKPPAYF